MKTPTLAFCLGVVAAAVAHRLVTDYRTDRVLVDALEAAADALDALDARDSLIARQHAVILRCNAWLEDALTLAQEEDDTPGDSPQDASLTGAFLRTHTVDPRAKDLGTANDVGPYYVIRRADGSYHTDGATLPTVSLWASPALAYKHLESGDTLEPCTLAQWRVLDDASRPDSQKRSTQ